MKVKNRASTPAGFAAAEKSSIGAVGTVMSPFLLDVKLLRQGTAWRSAV